MIVDGAVTEVRGFSLYGGLIRFRWTQLPHLAFISSTLILPCQNAGSYESSTAINGVFLNSSPNIWTPVVGHFPQSHSSHTGTLFTWSGCPSLGLCTHQANFPSLLPTLYTFFSTHPVRGSHSSSPPLSSLNPSLSFQSHFLHGAPLDLSLLRVHSCCGS